MKDRLVAMVAGVAVLVLVLSPRRSAALPAAQNTAPRLVSVTGEAEVRVVPDEVVLTLGNP
jgi:uncharacterized protein YggE